MKYPDETYIGRNVDEVQTELKILHPGSSIHTVTKYATVTMDFKMSRIRIWYDPKTNEVVEITNG